MTHSSLRTPIAPLPSPCLKHDIGGRETQEDRHIDIRDPSGWNVFAILDGHGGTAVVNRAASKTASGLGPMVLAALKELKTEETSVIRKRLETLFVEYDTSLQSMAAAQDCGTTVAMVLSPPSKSKLILVNLGDSEAHVYRADEKYRLVARTYPHKPNPARTSTDVTQRETYSEERRRIRASGGEIVNLSGEPDTWRVSVARSKNAMSLSRALGDLALKKRLDSGTKEWVTDHIGGAMSAVPTVTSVALPRGAGQKYVFVIACDGLWDVMTFADVADILREHSAGGKTLPICKRLIQQALQRNSTDNISTLVLEA